MNLTIKALVGLSILAILGFTGYQLVSNPSPNSGLIESQNNRFNVEKAESESMDLRETIISVSESGRDSTDKAVLDSGYKITLNQKQDYIDIAFESPEAYYPEDRWTLLDGKSRQNLTFGRGSYAIKGEDSPGVLAVRQEEAGNEYTIKYRVEFRNMYESTPSGARITEIDLQGNDSIAGGNLTMTNLGQKKSSVTLESGETVEKISTQVLIEN